MSDQMQAYLHLRRKDRKKNLGPDGGKEDKGSPFSELCFKNMKETLCFIEVNTYLCKNK